MNLIPRSGLKRFQRKKDIETVYTNGIKNISIMNISAGKIYSALFILIVDSIKSPVSFNYKMPDQTGPASWINNNRFLSLIYLLLSQRHQGLLLLFLYLPGILKQLEQSYQTLYFRLPELKAQ